jgi:hydroxypyruvate isomerase
MKYSQFIDEIGVTKQIQKVRFIKFSFMVTGVLVVILGLFESPTMWQFYTYRSQAAQHKSVHHLHQKISDEYKIVEAALHAKEKRKKKIHVHKKVVDALVYAVLLPSERYTIFYVKSEKNKARIQGRAKNMEGMYEAIKMLEEKSKYRITVDSLEKKERAEYVFSFVCVLKEIKKHAGHT